MAGGFREDLYNVTLTVNGPEGVSKSYVIDKMTGGGATATDTKYRPANGLANQLSLGGQVTVENATCSALYENTFDTDLLWLIAMSGRASIVLAKQPIDVNGAANGTALAYPGRLLDVKPPPTDSESSAAAMIEFTISTVGPIT